MQIRNGNLGSKPLVKVLLSTPKWNDDHNDTLDQTHTILDCKGDQSGAERRKAEPITPYPYCSLNAWIWDSLWSCF